MLLGKGARIGKNREGDETKVKKLGKKLGFQADYISLFQENKIEVSSTKIRELIREGNLSLAEKLLGRPHILLIKEFYLEKLNHKTLITFHAKDLCLPSPGCYSGIIMQNNQNFFSFFTIETQGKVEIILEKSFEQKPFYLIFHQELEKKLSTAALGQLPQKTFSLSL